RRAVHLLDGPRRARRDDGVDRAAVTQDARHDLAREVGVARVGALRERRQSLGDARAGFDAAQDFEGEATAHGRGSVATRALRYLFFSVSVPPPAAANFAHVSRCLSFRTPSYSTSSVSPSPARWTAAVVVADSMSPT